MLTHYCRDPDSETRNNAKNAFEIYKIGWPKNANRVFSRLPNQVMTSIAKLEKENQGFVDRSREPYDLSKAQTESALTKDSLNHKIAYKQSYGRRVS